MKKNLKWIIIYDKRNQAVNLHKIEVSKQISDLDDYRERIIKIFKKRYKLNVAVEFSYH